jgi:four helix bundle protein
VPRKVYRRRTLEAHHGVEEEADETAYWFELLIEGNIVPESLATELLKETNEIIAMQSRLSKRFDGRT